MEGWLHTEFKASLDYMRSCLSYQLHHCEVPLAHGCECQHPDLGNGPPCLDTFHKPVCNDRTLLLGIEYITAQIHLLECDLMGGILALQM